MVQITDVISEKLSSTVTSLETSPVIHRAASPVSSWVLCSELLPCARPAGKPTSPASPLCGPLRFSSAEEPRGAYWNRVAYEHSQYSILVILPLSEIWYSFRKIQVGKRNASLPRKFWFNSPACSTVTVTSLQEVAWLNLWAASGTTYSQHKMQKNLLGPCFSTFFIW